MQEKGKKIMAYIHNVSKVYHMQKNGAVCQALSGIEFQIYEGEFIAVMGASGAGKSTLLHMISGCDFPTEGEIFVGDQGLKKLNNRELAAYRREKIGIVFQQFHLIEYLTMLDNIMVPAILAEKEEMDALKHTKILSERLGISKLLEKYPYELSGGEKQRCAIARAMMNSPKLLLADELTGQLDYKSSGEVIKILEDLNKEGQTIFMVTHNPVIASKASKVMFLQDGKIYQQINKETEDSKVFYEKIMDTMSRMLFM